MKTLSFFASLRMTARFQSKTGKLENGNSHALASFHFRVSNFQFLPCERLLVDLFKKAMERRAYRHWVCGSVLQGMIRLRQQSKVA